MSTFYHGALSIPGSPDLSRLPLPGHSRTPSARPLDSRPSQCSPSHIELELHTDAYDTSRAENEALTTSSPGSRLARPFALSPGPDQKPITPHHSAISDSYLSYTPDQHVFPVDDLLNNRSTSHLFGLSPHHGHQVLSPAALLESSQLSSSSSRHAAINSHSERPRTSNQVFNNISDLAAHYGIPQFLPIAPRTTPRRTDIQGAPSSLQSESFFSSPHLQNLCSNYLTMLSHQPGDSGAIDIPAEQTSPVATTIEVTDADAVRSLMDVLIAGTPELQMSNDLNDYLTSPLIDSPFDDDLLATPAVGSDMHADILTSPLIFGGNDSTGDFSPLFGDDFGDPYQGLKIPENDSLPPSNIGPMYTFPSPSSPVIDFPGVSPSDAKTVPAKRKANVTGTRKNITPQSLVPIDAPTQTRKYLIPSATSRKELPATFRRKRLRTVEPGDEADQLAEDDLVPTTTEQQQIEAKRRQNTVAARRSRKRKLEYQRELEENADRCKRESEVWKQRALTCQALLRSHRIDCPEFPDP